MPGAFMAAMMGCVGGVSYPPYVGGMVNGFNGRTSDLVVNYALTGGLSSVPAAGDLVIVAVGSGTGTGSVNLGTVLAASGFTEIHNAYIVDGGADPKTNLVVGWKIMGGTPDTSFTITGGTGNNADAGVYGVEVWRGANATTPIGSTATSSSLDTAIPNPASITPTLPGSIVGVVGVGGHKAGSANAFTSSDLTAFKAFSHDDSNDASIGMGYKEWVSGAFDPAAFGWGGTDNVAYSNSALTYIINPA